MGKYRVIFFENSPRGCAAEIDYFTSLADQLMMKFVCSIKIPFYRCGGSPIAQAGRSKKSNHT
jgi:hypothetical protein